MITYGYSQQGKSHIQKGVVCQDSHRIEMLNNGWYVLVVADGVGSAKHSEDGSRIAAEMVARYCKKNVLSNMEGEEIIAILKNAYQIAFRQIELFCQEIKGNIEDYDTTLTTAIYTGAELYFGHAGDGGIVVKDYNGHYEMVTNLQKGVDGISVRPLRAGSDSWDFGMVDKNVAAVLLATDGMLDTLFPPELNVKQPFGNPMFQNDKKKNVYVTLAEFFLNADSVYRNRKIKKPSEFIESFLNGEVTDEQFNDSLHNAYSSLFDVKTADAICNTVEKYNRCTKAVDRVTDDRTVVCAINDKKMVSADNPQYYAEPDWKKLQHQLHMLLYPELYKNKDNIASDTADDLKDGEYAKVSLSDEIHMDNAIQGKDKDALRIREEFDEKISDSVACPTMSQATKAYQSTSRKKSKINIVIGFVLVLIAGCSMVGILFAKGKLRDKGDFAFHNSKKIEKNKDVDKTEKDSNINLDNTDSTEEKIDNGNDSVVEEKNTEDDGLSVQDKNIGTASSEQDKDVEQDNESGLAEFMLRGKSISFPCSLEQLRSKFTVIPNEIKEGYTTYFISEPDMEIIVKGISKSNNTDIKTGSQAIGNVSTENQTTSEIQTTTESVTFSETTEFTESQEIEEEQVESITIKYNNSGYRQQDTEISVQSAEIYCAGKCIARLGMSQNEFDNLSAVKWDKYPEGVVDKYRWEYEDIEYIVSIQDGIVCEMILQLK